MTSQQRAVVISLALLLAGCSATESDAQRTGSTTTPTAAIEPTTTDAPSSTTTALLPTTTALARDGSIASPYLIGDEPLNQITWDAPLGDAAAVISVDAIVASTSPTAATCTILVGHITPLTLSSGVVSALSDVPAYFAMASGERLDADIACDVTAVEAAGYTPAISVKVPAGTEVGWYHAFATERQPDLVGVGVPPEELVLAIDATMPIASSDLPAARRSTATAPSGTIAASDPAHYRFVRTGLSDDGATTSGEILAVVELGPGPLPIEGATCYGIVGVLTADEVPAGETQLLDIPPLAILTRGGLADAGYVACDSQALTEAGYRPLPEYLVEEGDTFGFYAIAVLQPDEVAAAVVFGRGTEDDLAFELVLSETVPVAP